jgi:hypothetical protein
MSLTIPRRTAAVTAVTVAAFSGVAMAGAAVSANAAVKAHTSLSIRVGRASINPGGSDTISGFLRARQHHVARHRIVLLDKPMGTTTWTKEKTHRTGPNGGIAFEVTPTVTTRYMLVFPGNKFQQAAHSGVGVVRVRDTTSLTIALGAGSISPGDSDAVTGVLSLNGTALVGDTVNLLGRSGKHRFTRLGSAITASDGSVDFTVTPAVTSHYVLVFRKTETNAGARSAVATVRVLLSSSLSIRARENRKTGHEVVSGELRGGGHGLPHRNVTLQERPSGTTTWTAVSTERTGKHGFISFNEPGPTSSEDYQLVFSGGPVFSGCQSGIVTVTVS